MFKNFIKASDKYLDRDVSVPAPYIRRAFVLDFEPKSTRVAITTPGFYELYVNGKRITKGYLAPYISNPDHFVCYDEYDITDLVKKGKNAVGIILGNGYANQITPQWEYSSAPFRAPLSVSLTLRSDGDGKSLSLESDESFKCAPSPIVYDMYRYGTHYDARLEIDGWCEADFDDSAWAHVSLAEVPRGEIVKATAEPITKREELSAVSISKKEDFFYLRTAFRGGEDVEFSHVSHAHLYDFGVSTAGVCRLKISGKAGQKITLRYGEKLTDDGTFTLNSIYTFNQQNLEYIPNFQTDVYILKGNGCEEYTPSFTYHGFRYVLVEGMTDEQATPDALTLEVISSDISPRSSFNSSSEILNRLYEMGIRADISNFHYFPTDCPHREKNGWTGDITSSAEQLLLSFDCKESLKLWLRSLRSAQLDSGMLPGIAPTTGWGYKWGNGPFWDAAAVIAPYYAYKYDSDISLFSENADMIAKYISYIRNRRDERGLVAVGLGDWVQPKNRELGILSPLELTDSVTVYNIAIKAARLYRVIGREDDAVLADSFAGDIRRAVREHLIDYGTMTAKGSCQTSQALLLYFGMFEENEKKAAYRRLIEIIEADERHLMCGVIGLRYLFDVLIDGGDCDLALELITNPDEPSYAAMIYRGATALCESLDENGLNESENHHFLGDIIRVFVSRIAGLLPNPSLSNRCELVFSPVFPKSLDYAEAEYRFECGTAKCGWRRQGGKLILSADLPDGVKGVYKGVQEQLELHTGHNEITLNC